jgi:hypothetical protein
MPGRSLWARALDMQDRSKEIEMGMNTEAKTYLAIATGGLSLPFTSFAKGGTVLQQTPVLVGEKEPEVAVHPNGTVEIVGKKGAEIRIFDPGTKIIPRNKLPRAAAGTGPGGVPQYWMLPQGAQQAAGYTPTSQGGAVPAPKMTTATPKFTTQDAFRVLAQFGAVLAPKNPVAQAANEFAQDTYRRQQFGKAIQGVSPASSGQPGVAQAPGINTAAIMDVAQSDPDTAGKAVDFHSKLQGLSINQANLNLAQQTGVRAQEAHGWEGQERIPRMAALEGGEARAKEAGVRAQELFTSQKTEAVANAELAKKQTADYQTPAQQEERTIRISQAVQKAQNEGQLNPLVKARFEELRSLRAYMGTTAFTDLNEAEQKKVRARYDATETAVAQALGIGPAAGVPPYDPNTDYTQ